VGARLDSGLGFQAKAIKTFQLFPLRSNAVPARIDSGGGGGAASLRLTDFFKLTCWGFG
jgi:hypothetical protein